MKIHLLSTTFILSTWLASAQGTFVYDQESSSDEVSPFGAVPIQAYSSLGQSFTPSLATVSFVRLRLFDVNPDNGTGATLVVNLRADSMSGTILGTSQAVLTNGFSGAVNFLFGTGVPVVPNSLFFFETVVQAGDFVAITLVGDTYAKGSVFPNGFPATGNDLWFREGIIVPEPSVDSLVVSGTLAVAWLSRRNRRTR